MLLKPLVEFFQQERAAFAVFKLEVDAAAVAVGWSQHINLTLAAALKRDGIQLRFRAGFYIERHQFQLWPIPRHGFQLAVQQRTVSMRLAVEHNWRCDKALHHVAVRRKDISFVHIDAALLQAPLQPRQLPILLTIQAQHRPMVEINEIQRAQFHLLLALQDGFSALAVFRRNKCHRILRTQTQVAGTIVRRQPEFDLRPIGGVPPMTRQNKTLLMLGQMPTLENVSSVWILVGARLSCSICRFPALSEHPSVSQSLPIDMKSHPLSIE